MRSSSRPDSSSSGISPLILSFLVGVVSASTVFLFWAAAASVPSYAASEEDAEEENENLLHPSTPKRNGGSSRDTMPDSSPLFLRWPSMDELKSRIGELPSSYWHSLGGTPTTTAIRRTPWPWDRKATRSRSQSPTITAPPTSSGEVHLPAPPLPQPPPPDTAPNHNSTLKSEVCIGSIFGLDVGGTLAKLVYFEQKSEQRYDSQFRTSSMRDRWYRSSASAQAVLLARRGQSSTVVGEGNGLMDAASAIDRDRDNDIGDDDELITASAGLLRHGLGVRPRSKSVSDSSSPRLGSFSPSARPRSVLNRGGDIVVEPTTMPRDRRRRSTSLYNRHSDDSNNDLKSLYDLRPESVPDDLHAYADSVFERQAHQQQRQSSDPTANHTLRGCAPSSADSPASSAMRKSRSMLDVSQGRMEALDRFYNFARRLDSYREGIKDHKLSFYSRPLGGEFHFIRFESRRMNNAMDLIRANHLHHNIRQMGATGGGAHKFANQWQRELGITMQKQDELDSLVAGMQFVLSTVVGECYTFRPRTSGTPPPPPHHHGAHGRRNASFATSSASDPASDDASSPDADEDHPVGAPLEDDESSDLEEEGDEEGPSHLPPQDQGKGDEWWWSRKVQRDAISYSSAYPYLLVTIGTGVSILRVDGPRQHVRVSGSTIGGGTYWGLIRLLTDMEDFDAVLKLAERGDPTKVDMMVGDIYGESDVVQKMGLRSDLVASSFGKLVAKDDPSSDLKEEDLARALLLMITINIGQVAYLNAQLHKTSRIYFVGNFLRENKISQRRLSFAIHYWSKGEMEALFLEHEGYFGALGAFLLSQGISESDFCLPNNLRSQDSLPTSINGDVSPLYKLHKRSETIGSM